MQVAVNTLSFIDQYIALVPTFALLEGPAPVNSSSP